MSTPFAALEEPRELELTNADTVRLEATRYLFFPGDVIEPQQKRDRPHWKGGGEHVDSKCLVRTGGFLPRCRVTPMEFWAAWLPAEEVPEGTRTMSLPSKQSEPVGFVNGSPVFLPQTLFGVPIYPGEHIGGILHADQKRGIVEIVALRGKEWKSGEAQNIQRLFFPVDIALPETLRGVENRIRKVVAEFVSNDVVQSVAGDMLEGCAQFREWGEQKIEVAHSRLKQRVSHQHVHSYSPVERILLQQLEVAPQDQGMQLLAQGQHKLMEGMQAGGMSPEQFTQVLEQQDKRFQSMFLEFGKMIAQAFRPDAEAQPSAVEQAQPEPKPEPKPEQKPKEEKPKPK